MGLFTSSKKKQATAGYAAEASHGSPSFLALPLPCMDGFAGLPYQQASYAVSMPAFDHNDSSMSFAAEQALLAPPHPPQNYYQPPNIVVNQNYYFAAAPLPNVPETAIDKASTMASVPKGISSFPLGSVVNLATDMLPISMPHFFDDRPAAWHVHVHVPGTTLLNQGAALYDQVSSKFDRVVTAIDRDRYEGNENELFSYGASSPLAGPLVSSGPSGTRNRRKGQSTGAVSSLISGSYFAKVDLYANSKLPLNLPPMTL